MAWENSEIVLGLLVNYSRADRAFTASDQAKADGFTVALLTLGPTEFTHAK